MEFLPRGWRKRTRRVRFSETLEHELVLRLPGAVDDGRLHVLGDIFVSALAGAQAEFALRQSEQLNRDILSSLNEQVALIDRAGVILSVNQAWYRFLRDCSQPDQPVIGTNYLETCRRGAAAGNTDAERVLAGLESGKIELKLAPGFSSRAFFELMLQNTMEGFFADPLYGGNRDMAAWKMIGYPGARYNYLDWVNRHNEKYPLPPVSLAGRAEWTRR